MYTFKSRARPRPVDPIPPQLTLCSSAQRLQISTEGTEYQKTLTRKGKVFPFPCCGRERGMETAVGKAENAIFTLKNFSGTSY